MRRVEFFLPRLLPTPALNANGGEKRIGPVVGKEKKAQREAVYYGVLADDVARAAIGQFQFVHLFMELRWYKRRRDGSVYLPSDAQNAAHALKAAADGLVDAGLIPGDSYKHVDIFSARVRRVATYEEEGVWVSITELEEAA